MNLFVWFDPTTGLATEWTSGRADLAGCVLVADDTDPLTVYLDTGGVVRPLPAAPGPAHVWVRALGAWVDGGDLARRRDEAEAVMAAAVDAAADLVTGLYPETERRTWTEQERGARAVLADLANPDGPVTLLPEDAVLLEPIAARRGLTLADLAPVIVAKADGWRAVAGALIGARAAASAAFAEAATAAEVEAALAQGEVEVGAVVEAALAPTPADPETP